MQVRAMQLLLLPLLLLLLSTSCCHAAAAAGSGIGGSGPDETTSSNSGTALASDPLASPRSPSSTTVRLTSSRSAPYVANELLLREITQECAKRQNSVLQLDAAGRLQVLPSLPADAPCGALDIALRGSERGVGMCTNAALYVLHMGPSGREGQGARILPLLSDAAMAAYSAKCAQTTARVFLESVYHEWLAPAGSNGYHLMQVCGWVGGGSAPRKSTLSAALRRTWVVVLNSKCSHTILASWLPPSPPPPCIARRSTASTCSKCTRSTTRVSGDVAVAC
jgi:hypothetical protein